MVMLALPVHNATTFVLARPHYPENVGAAARAIKTMGFSRLALVRPGRLAVPEHEMALKMAVKSRDVLADAVRYASLREALASAHHVVATTSRRGMTGVLTLGDGAVLLERLTAEGHEVAIVFGNEKTGLDPDELALADTLLRIPMAADQPSINLAQAVQLVAYALFARALQIRGKAHGPDTTS
jgi:TrmH family RNA methyltransferase